MPLFVLFVFGAVIIGAGAMLSPAWPTAQPRVALLAALALALIMGGTIFYSMLFGWETLVIDYLLFALVVGIFLGGTLSVGQSRAEAKGEVLEDVDQGWPGPQDLSILVVIALIFALPVFILPTTLGTAGQENGFFALTVREGETFDSLAPFVEGYTYLEPPAVPALIAYLSQQLGQGIHIVQFAVGAIVAFLNVWIAYDLGSELQSKRLGRAMALAMLLSLAVFGMMIEGYFTQLFGLLFLQAFVTFGLRYIRHRYPIDLVAGGLMLGAIAITDFEMMLVAVLGLLAWLISLFLAKPRVSLPTWLGLALGFPLVALIGIAPWLFNLPDASTSQTAVTEASADFLIGMLRNHGWWIVPVAMIGWWARLKERDSLTLLAGVWLILILEYSVIGISTSLFPDLARYASPMQVARFGPIIPYSILGGMGLLWLWETLITPRLGSVGYRGIYALAGVSGVAVIGFMLMAESIIPTNKDTFKNFPPAYASHADIDAMEWLYENTTFEDTFVVNTYLDGNWVPVVSERETVYIPLVPYTQRNTPLLLSHNIDSATIGIQAIHLFWHTPDTDDMVQQLRDVGITHVIVPQIMSNPDSYDSAWRWDEPPTSDIIADRLQNTDYLELVYENDGAQVYAVRAE